MSTKRIRKTIAPRRNLLLTVTPPEPAGGPPAGGGGGTGQGGDPGSGGSGTAAPPEKTFTQADIDRIVAREKESASSKAVKDLAEQLGVTIDEAKEIVKSHKDKTDAEKSDAQKAREAADKEKAEAVEAKAAAALETHTTRADRALVTAGIAFPKDATDDQKDATLLRVRGMLTVKPGATAAEIAADVKSLKEGFPGLFAPGGTGKGSPNSDPKTPPGGGTSSGDKTGMQIGAERAAQRYKDRSRRPLPAGTDK